MDKPSARISKPYICLECGHKDNVRQGFPEVINCPKCAGLYVDALSSDLYKVVFRNYNAKDKTKGSVPLLSIVLDDINSVPAVHYKGEEISMKQRVSFDWITRGEFFTPTYISVEHMDMDTQDFNTKVIQHNQPLGRSDE